MTSIRRVDSAACGHLAPDHGQKSHPSRFDRRRVDAGRSVAAHRRVQSLPVITISRDEASAFWADLVRRRCGSRERCAVMFGVTFQTACNWFDEFSCPTGDKVLQAQRWWPEDFKHD